jgi:hypothetical protein
MDRWRCVTQALKGSKAGASFSWVAAKMKHDIALDQGDAEIESAVSYALGTVSVGVEDDRAAEAAVLEVVDPPQDDILLRPRDPQLPQQVPPMDAVELSQSVMRWLDRADAEYLAMFHKKVALLAQGNRTYALSKRLKHCAVPIFETKLDAGQRILWTQLARGESQRHLLVRKPRCEDM